MALFCLEIAGQTAQVNSLFESTPHHFSKYLSCQEPVFSITVTEQDLRFEQEDADAEAREEGFRRRAFPEPFLERTAIWRQFAEHLLWQDILPVHGSTVAVDGQAYLFTARSGTGKSTHTRLWREVFAERALMVNDDRPFLHLSSDGLFAYGSPWSGKHGLDSNICAPLQGICLLERGCENTIQPARPEDVKELLRGFRPRTPEQAAQYDRLLNRLLQQVPLWHMACNKEKNAAVIAYKAMSK